MNSIFRTEEVSKSPPSRNTAPPPAADGGMILAEPTELSGMDRETTADIQGEHVEEHEGKVKAFLYYVDSSILGYVYVQMFLTTITG